MLWPALEGVFTRAAGPQQAMLILLICAIPGTLIAAVLAAREGERNNFWRRIVADVRVAGPVLGLLVAGLNSFHMGETIQRLPFDPTLKQLAPAIFEISMFVCVGALVGLVAVVANATLGVLTLRKRAG